LRDAGTKRTSYSGTAVAGTQEDGNTDVKFFCNQAQTTGVVAHITINLFVNLSMALLFLYTITILTSHTSFYKRTRS